MGNEELCKKFDKKHPKFFTENPKTDNVHLFSTAKMEYLTTCHNPRKPIPGSGELGLKLGFFFLT
jgi:hypothetical protein